MLIPILLFAAQPFSILPGLHYTFSYILVLILWTILVFLISPLYTRYRLLENEKPVFFKILLQRTNFAAIFAYCTGILLGYYHNVNNYSEYSRLFVSFFLPVAGCMLAIAFILSMVSYLNERKKFNRKNNK
jgi:hypothetical protein